MRPIPHIVLPAGMALVLAVDLFVVSQGSVATPVSRERALDRFRATPSATAAPTKGAARPRASTSPTPSSARPTAVPTASSGTRRATALPFDRPQAGVYSYTTSGWESIDMAGARHDYPEESFATVRLQSGCRWEIEHRVIEEHTDTETRCAARNRDLWVGATTRVAFFGQTDEAIYVCRVPLVIVDVRDPPGAAHEATCDETQGGEARLKSVNLGRARVSIGGVPVNAYRVRVDSTLTGRSRGTGHWDYWLHPATGLWLRQERRIDTQSKSTFGDVHYQEEAAFLLRSLTPST